MLLHHVTLIVNDLQAAATFYHRELGLEIIDVPGLDYPAAFFRINELQELHLAEFPDVPASYRGHFCLRIDDFNAAFHRFRELGILDVGPWGKLRELPNGSLQLYVRDPAGNLVELTSRPEDRATIDPAIFAAEEWGGMPYQSGRADGRRYGAKAS
jgi:catechol 2,3-dioxygenase-like lactoylglutathione lyase family enzyme